MADTENRGSLANALMIGLIGILLVMTGFGLMYGSHVRAMAAPEPVKPPLLSEMASEVSTQFNALKTKVADASAELAGTMSKDVEFDPQMVGERLGGVAEKVEKLAKADDAVYGSLQELKSKADTLVALAQPPLFIETIVPGLKTRKEAELATKDLPKYEAVLEMRTNISRLEQAFHVSGYNTEAAVSAAVAHANRQLALLDAANLRHIDGRRDYVKAVKVRTSIEKLLGEVRDRHPGWLHWGRVNILVMFVLLSAAILIYIARGRAGETLTIRRIAGLNALDEAVGRATEMGKPVLFVTGIMDLDDIQTLAGLNILGHVARKTAEYESNLQVPSLWPMTMSAAQEIVRESYLRAGKPDNFRADSVYYLSSDQFAFAAGASGIMNREKPATVFYMGSFYAESLLMAEVGNLIGAIQIAGTAQQTQLPFFVAACDYTLIGEEMFAASAYLSNEPMLRGSLKGQDAGKVVMMAVIVLGGAIELLIAVGVIPVSWSLYRFFTLL